MGSSKQQGHNSVAMNDLSQTPATPTPERIITEREQADRDWIIELANKTANPNYQIQSADKSFWGGWNLLSYAAYRGYDDVVEMLIKRGANPNLPVQTTDSWNDWTPLMVAAYRRNKMPSNHTCKVLLKHKANPHVIIPSGANKGWVLSAAVAAQQNEFNYPKEEIKDFIIEGMNPRQTIPGKKHGEESLLQFLINNNDYEVASFLLQVGADPTEIIEEDKLLRELNKKIENLKKKTSSYQNSSVYEFKKLLMGNFYFYRNQFNYAKDSYEQDEENPLNYYATASTAKLLGLLAFHRGSYSEALQRFQWVIKIANKDIDKQNDFDFKKFAIEHMALIYLKTEKYDIAVKGFDRAIQLDPMEPTYHWYKYQAFCKLDNKMNEAVESLEQAVRLAEKIMNPKNPNCPYHGKFLTYSSELIKVKKEEETKVINIVRSGKIKQLEEENKSLKEGLFFTRSWVKKLEINTQLNHDEIQNLHNQMKELEKEFTDRFAEFERQMEEQSEGLHTSFAKRISEMDESVSAEIARILKLVTAQLEAAKKERESLIAEDNINKNRLDRKINALEEEIIDLKNKKSAEDLKDEAEAIFKDAPNDNLLLFFRAVLIGLENLLDGIHELSTKLFKKDVPSPSVDRAKLVGKFVGASPIGGNLMKLLINGGANVAQKYVNACQTNLVFSISNKYTSSEARIIAVRTARELTQRLQNKLLQLPVTVEEDILDKSKKKVLKEGPKRAAQQVANYAVEQISEAVFNETLAEDEVLKLTPGHCIRAVLHKHNTLEKAADTVNTLLHRGTIKISDKKTWYIPDIFRTTGIQTGQEPIQYFCDNTPEGKEHLWLYGYCVASEREATIRGWKANEVPFRNGSTETPIIVEDNMFCMVSKEEASAQNENNNNSPVSVKTWKENCINKKLSSSFGSETLFAESKKRSGKKQPLAVVEYKHFKSHSL